MTSLYNNLKIEQLLAPTNSTSTKTSSSIDTIGFNDRLFVAHLGFSLDTLNVSNYWTVKLQHGDSSGSLTDTADSDIASGVASYIVNDSSLDEQAYVFGYVGDKRYIRLRIEKTGNFSSGTPLAVTALLGAPAVAPVA